MFLLFSDGHGVSYYPNRLGVFGSDVGYYPNDGMTFSELRLELSRQNELGTWTDWRGPSHGWPLRGKWCPTLQGTYWTAMDGTPFPLKRWEERVRLDCRGTGWNGDWDGRLNGPLYSLAVRVDLDLGVSSLFSVGC
jgi:hypothetical protein